MSAIKDGMMEPGQAPEHWGFTLKNFEEGSYLWITGKKCTVSFIVSRKKGAGCFSRLVKAVEKDGYALEVPTPLGRMKEILTRWGFKPTEEWAEDFKDHVTIWKR